MLYIPDIHFTRLSYFAAFGLGLYLVSVYLLVFNIIFFLFDPFTSVRDAIATSNNSSNEENKTGLKKTQSKILTKTFLIIVKVIGFLLGAALLVFNTYYFSKICSTYWTINIATIIGFLLFIIGHVALLPHENSISTSSFVTALLFPVGGYFWMSSILHTGCMGVLNLGLLISKLSFYKQLVCGWLMFLGFSWVFVFWRLGQVTSMHYRFLSLFLAKDQQAIPVLDIYHPESEDTHDMLKSALLTEKYRPNVSKLTGNNMMSGSVSTKRSRKVSGDEVDGITYEIEHLRNGEEDTQKRSRRSSEQTDGNEGEVDYNAMMYSQDSGSPEPAKGSNGVDTVGTREDVFFHLFMGMNCLFFGKMLTSWIQIDRFGYLVEIDTALWINLGSMLVFLVVVLLQLFYMKKYRSKFT